MYYINPVHKLLHTMTDFIIRDATSDALVHDQCVSNRVMTDFVRIFKTFVRVHAANDFYDSDTLPRPANQQTECVLATMLYEYEARFPNDNIFTDFPIVHPSPGHMSTPILDHIASGSGPTGTHWVFVRSMFHWPSSSCLILSVSSERRSPMRVCTPS